jgi:uncharacterized cupredoxin-like copper-binding protein
VNIALCQTSPPKSVSQHTFKCLTNAQGYGSLFRIMNHNNVSPEQKDSAIKTLAIIGLLASVVVGIWLAITIIQFLPTAFKNLASIADGLYGKGSVFTVTPEKNSVNSGESMELYWTNVTKDGEYAFSYHCTDGVSVEVRDSKGDIAKVTCDSPIFLKPGNLKGGKETLNVVFASEKQRFTDVLVTVEFFEEGKDVALYEKNTAITVVNASIPESGSVAKPEPTKPVVTPKPTPKPTTPTGYYTVPVTKTGYAESDPKGFTDLQFTLVGAGTISSNGTFTAKSSLDKGDESAVQFIVKNVGTKTSNDWTYKIEFPASGDDIFTSKSQSPLLPGERAVMTLRFTATDKIGTANLRGSVSTSGDTKTANNSATKDIKIVR